MVAAWLLLFFGNGTSRTCCNTSPSCVFIERAEVCQCDCARMAMRLVSWLQLHPPTRALPHTYSYRMRAQTPQRFASETDWPDWCSDAWSLCALPQKSLCAVVRSSKHFLSVLFVACARLDCEEPGRDSINL